MIKNSFRGHVGFRRKGWTFRSGERMPPQQAAVAFFKPATARKLEELDEKAKGLPAKP